MTPVLENQFSLARYWEQGDAISHLVAYVLLAMSLVSWFFILSKAYAAWRVRRSAPAVDAFWDAANMHEGVAGLERADAESIYAPLARQGAAQLMVSGRPTLGGEMGHAEQ